jgi:cysteine desulfurase
MKRVYFDHNATTPVRPEVLEAMLPFYRETFGNPSSVHHFGREAHRHLEAGRSQVAAAIHAKPEEIVFTGGGTEADNLAIQGVVAANAKKGKHIVTSRIEHHAVLRSCQFLEKQGYPVTYLPVGKDGRVSLEEVAKAIRPETVLITVMAANNETGVLQPIREIGGLARERGILFHTDAVQALGKIPISVENLPADLISLSAHKIYGPKGVGALYIRKGTRVQPLLHGGHHEHGKRAGTENVAGIVGFGKACEFAVSELAEESARLALLRNRLCSDIGEKIESVFLNGHPAERLPNTLNLSFAYVEGEAIVLGLDMKGVAVATGSACTSGTLEPSHVLTAMGVEAALAQGSIRFSLGRDNTLEDVATAVPALAEVVARLRAMSPFAPPPRK